jgi:hypothetical protein
MQRNRVYLCRFRALISSNQKFLALALVEEDVAADDKEAFEALKVLLELFI